MVSGDFLRSSRCWNSLRLVVAAFSQQTQVFFFLSEVTRQFVPSLCKNTAKASLQTSQTTQVALVFDISVLLLLQLPVRMDTCPLQ